MTSISDAVSETLNREAFFPAGVKQQDQRGGVNVSLNERTISTAAGVAMVLAGLTRPTTTRGLVLSVLGGMAVYRGISGHCSLYSALGISTAKPSHEPSAEPEEYSSRSIHVEEAVTIMKGADELYSFWRNLENLPRFMSHLKEVKQLDQKRSRWIARGPLNLPVEWEAEIINEEPGKLIAWKSMGSAMVDSSGSVRFLEQGDDRGTEVRVTLDYIPPAGRIGATIAKLFGREPEQEIRKDLRRFKQLHEAGEIATNAAGEPRGDCKCAG